MEDLKSNLLNYLREFKSERVVFKVNDAIEKLKVSREEFEEALFALEDKGYLTIIKIPPSSTVVSRLRARIRELNISFMMGRVSESEYLEKWKKITGITSPDAFKDVEPLPPKTLRDLLKALEDACKYLEKLRKEKEVIYSKIFMKLYEIYINNFINIGNLLNNFTEILIAALKKVRDELEEIWIKSEVLEQDSRIRGIDRGSEVRTLEKAMGEVLRGVQKLAERVGLSPQPGIEVGDLAAMLVKLEKELDQAEKSLQIIKARARIEGEEKYRAEIYRLEERVRYLEERVAVLRSSMSFTEAGDDLVKELNSLKEKLESLPEDVVSEDLRRPVIETLSRLSESLRLLIGLMSAIRRGATLQNVPELLGTLRDIP